MLLITLAVADEVVLRLTTVCLEACKLCTCGFFTGSHIFCRSGIVAPVSTRGRQLCQLSYSDCQ